MVVVVVVVVVYRLPVDLAVAAVNFNLGLLVVGADVVVTDEAVVVLDSFFSLHNTLRAKSHESAALLKYKPGIKIYKNVFECTEIIKKLKIINRIY